jgi:hypothetical protein
MNVLPPCCDARYFISFILYSGSGANVGVKIPGPNPKIAKVKTNPGADALLLTMFFGGVGLLKTQSSLAFGGWGVLGWVYMR